jgi:hypothetical protein
LPIRAQITLDGTCAFAIAYQRAVIGDWNDIFHPGDVFEA